MYGKETAKQGFPKQHSLVTIQLCDCCHFFVYFQGKTKGNI